MLQIESNVFDCIIANVKGTTFRVTKNTKGMGGRQVAYKVVQGRAQDTLLFTSMLIKYRMQTETQKMFWTNIIRPRYRILRRS